MLTRAVLLEQLRARLDGRLSTTQLAEWAFDRFYACELEEETLDPLDADLLATVIDDLMFAVDDPSFALDDEALRALINRLEQP